MTDLGLTNNNEMTPASSDANDPAALASTAPAAKKPVTRKISPRKTEPAKPVVTQSSAKKATAKKTPPLKAKTAKAVVAPPQVARPTVRRSEQAASAKAAASEPARETAKAKTKLVRDSFTMPQQDFGLIAVLKDRALGFKRPAKKSELLRAGLHALQQLTDAQLRGALDSLVPLKAGRPRKKAN